MTKSGPFTFGFATPHTVLELLAAFVPTDQTHGAHRADTLGLGLTPGPPLGTLAWRGEEQRPITLAHRVLEPMPRRNVLDLQECGGRRIDRCGGHRASVGAISSDGYSPSGDDSAHVQRQKHARNSR